jgi:hypothetical protein
MTTSLDRFEVLCSLCLAIRIVWCLDRFGCLDFSDRQCLRGV